MSIVLHGPSSRIPVYGLVDSGASDTLIPFDLMSYLGILVADCRIQQCETAGGMTDQYVWPNDLEVELQAMGRGVTVKPSFTRGLPPRVVLLGRRDFFHEFRIEFDERSQSFSLEPYDP